MLTRVFLRRGTETSYEQQGVVRKALQLRWSGLSAKLADRSGRIQYSYYCKQALILHKTDRGSVYFYRR